MAGMVRLGGIAAFVAVLMVVVTIALGQTIATNKILGIILSLVMTGCILLTFWTTKTLFNANNYRRADIAIMGVIALFVLWWLLSLVGGGGMSMGGTGVGILGIIALIVLLAVFVVWILFSIQSMGYAPTGGGVWKAIGILYLITCILIILALVFLILGGVTKSVSMLGVGGFLFLIGGLVWIASLIVHGIGLLGGAGKMSA